MIADTLKNRHLYGSLSPRIKDALDHIAKTDFSAIGPGKYELDGANLYVLVQAYDSIPLEQGKWECHRDYIDIQYIVEGIEQIGFGNINNMQVSTEYNAEKDIAFLTGEGDLVTLGEGSYAIFYPEDAHKPKLAPDNKPGAVKKLVVKIKVD